MAHLIDKDHIVAELEKRYKYWREKEFNSHSIESEIRMSECQHLMLLFNTLEVKEAEEYKQPEYSCIETVYRCGKKPRWNLGDTLAYYEFYSDREGECILGKVSKAEFDEDQCDWFYTFEDGSACSEQSLLEEETYKKN